MIGTTETKRALYGKLAGDVTLNALLDPSPPAGYNKAIYYEVAPDGAHYPFVIFQKQAGTPKYGWNSANPLVDEIWLIKGVDRNDLTSDVVERISFRLKALLTDATLSVSGATPLYLRFESDVDYGEDTNSKRFYHSGSMYRLIYT